MRLKIYRAPRMAEAMARVRTELGEDALILASRQVDDGVEVTAALEVEDDPPPPPLKLDVDQPHRAALIYHCLLYTSRCV